MPKNEEEKLEGNIDLDKIVNGNVMSDISNITVDDIADKKQEVENKVEEKEKGFDPKDRPMPKRVMKIIETDPILKGEKIPLRIWIVKHRPSPFAQAKLLEYLGNPSFDKIFEADDLTEKYNEIAKAVKE